MKILLMLIAITFVTNSCIEDVNECTTCYSVTREISTGSIINRDSEGTKCGSEIDSLENISVTLDDYEMFYECD